MSVLFFVVGLIGRRTFCVFLLHDSQYQTYYDLFLCIMLFCGTFSIYQSYMQAEQKSKRYVVISVSYTLVYILLSVLLLTVLQLPGYAMLLSLLVTNIIFFCIAIADVFFVQKSRFTVSSADFKQCAGYSIPLLPNVLAGSLVGFLSKYILSISDSISSSGIFGICMQFGNIMEVFNTSTNNALRPWFNAKMDTGDASGEINSTINVIHKGVGVICCAATLFSQEVVIVMTDSSYHDAWKAVPIMIAAYFIRFIFFNNTLPALYNIRMSKYVSVLSVSGCLINVLICAFLSEPLGIYGCALAYLIQNLLMAAAAMLLASKSGVFRLDNANIWKSSVFVLILSIVGLIPSYIWFSGSLSIVNIVIKAAVLAAVTVILMKGQTMVLLNFVKGMLKKEENSAK